MVTTRSVPERAETHVPAARMDSTRSLSAGAGSLDVQVRRPCEDVLVVQATGELDTAARRCLAEPVRQRLVGTASMVVVDLSGITFINSEGACVLLEACQHAELTGKDLVLISSPAVDRLLRLLAIADRFAYRRSSEAARPQRDSLQLQS